MPSAPPPDWTLARRRAVGDRIRELRTWRNLTQEKLAEKCDMDRRSVNRIEQGYQAPGLDTLQSLGEGQDHFGAVQTALALFELPHG
ncbi:helix-turn-helix domain-containing protein [Streptomyces melanosporofaciens]|uniref:helix-turn-helix domain-containing protein n=1 Tax=unclassified Streptomyces TaxID=2593676 RepID=UPI00369F6AB4